MNEQQYQTLISWVKQSPLRCRFLLSLCCLLPYSIFFFYIIGSLYLFLHFLSNGFAAEYLLFWLVPAIGFILVSVLRQILNAKRPYEYFNFTPLLQHEGGSSFPSRHTACAFLISFALLFLSLLGLFSPALVVLSFLLAVLTGISRIVVGVHFPKDVLGGFLFAAVISFLGFSIAFFLL